MQIDTVAILNTGEMGHNVARVLKEQGLRTVTCLTGRSERTARLAAKAGVMNLPTLIDVVDQSDLIISIVVPSAAAPLAEEIGEIIALTGKSCLFADANAISATTAKAIENIIMKAGARFVDVSIIGGAARVGKDTSFYVSGAHAQEFAELGNRGLKIEILGDQSGQASAFKIVYAGLTKGLTSLMLEQLMLAKALGILEPVIERYRSKFPDLVEQMEGTLPGIPFRAARRSDEMGELTQTLEEEGISPIMAPASQRMLASVGALNLRKEYTDADEATWDMKKVVALLQPRLATKK